MNIKQLIIIGFLPFLIIGFYYLDATFFIFHLIAEVIGIFILLIIILVAMFNHLQKEIEKQKNDIY